MFKLFLLLFVSFLPCTWQIDDDSIYINVYYEALCPRTREFFITQLSPALLAFPNLIQYRIIPFGEAEVEKILLFSLLRYSLYSIKCFVKRLNGITTRINSISIAI